MGSGFAEVFAGAGISAVLADASLERANEGRAAAVSRARDAEARGMWPAGTGDRVEGNLSAAGDIGEAASGAQLVLEAVTENPAVKAAGDSVVATNTSAIPIEQLAKSFGAPQRFLGAHWFNPPQWVPCVELIPSTRTDPEVVERLRSCLRALGKRAVVVGDAAGFVANRIQFAMFKEAAAVVEEGVASAEAVDEVVRSSFGFRLPFFGPFMIADMAGLDVYEGAYRALEENIGPHLAPPRAVTEMVAAGRVGTKVGAGYLEHDPARIREILERRDQAYAALGDLVRRMFPDD